MKNFVLACSAAFAATALVAPASAAIQWADLTGQPSSNTVVGTVAGVGVTYTGDVNFVQLAGGTDYWNPFPSADRPTGTDIISINNGGTKTVTFASAVTDVYLALNSWNGQDAVFDHPYTVVAQGCGYWGCGVVAGTSTSTELFASGELHGIIQFAGPITTLSFTDVSENWHGIQIGIGSVAGAVPEPATWALVLAGFGLTGAALRRRAKTAVQFG
jgi:hypothetical protein